MGTVPASQLVFPDSDGKPIAETTRQFDAITTLKGNIEAIARNAFVAADNFIYPDPLDPAACQAPDVYVAFGRPRGHRGSSKVWEEDGVFPQVVFEVLGPSNTPREMEQKRDFYFGHGAEEYFEFDPEAGTWLGFVVEPASGLPVAVPQMDGYVSPRLGMRFAFRPLELLVYRPDGSVFLSFQELNDLVELERRRAAAERARADAARDQADAAAREVDRLRALLKDAGLDPDAPPPVAP